MPSHIENGIAYLNGLKVGDIYGSNYISVSNAGVMTLTGTATIVDGSATVENFKSINIAYDTSNYFQLSVGSTGAGKITAVGSADSFEIETGDGKIILDAKTDIDLDPEGNDINLLGSGAGKITMAATTVSIFGGDTTGDALILQGNSADATEKITITGATGTDISGNLIVDKVSWAGYLSGAASASGLLMGVGTSGTPATTATADAKFVEFRCQNTATSGDNRLTYMRFEMAGAGASGECVRAFTDLTAAVNTARGSHMSLQIDDTGYVTGLGAGIDAQLYVGNAAVAAGGTYAALNVEIYSEGSSSSIAAVTESSFIRINNGGDATGAGVVDDNAVLFDLNGFTSGAAKLWYDNQGGAPANVEEWIKIRTPAGIRYLAVYNAVV